jgi:Protein of unknown function (DUF2781).
MHTLTPNIVIDTVPLLPAFLQTNLSHQLREFYITTYRDKFFEDPPAWFTVFIWMELLYHLPLSIWATRGLLKGIFFKSPFSSARARTSYMFLCISLYPGLSSSVHPPTSHHSLHIYIKCNIWKSDYNIHTYTHSSPRIGNHIPKKQTKTKNKKTQ